MCALLYNIHADASNFIYLPLRRTRRRKRRRARLPKGREKKTLVIWTSHGRRSRLSYILSPMNSLTLIRL